MDLRFLESFIAVAELKSFSKAAEKLHLTQPGISSRIQNLEKELGFSLFIRLKGETKLTPNGEALFYHVKRGLAEINDAITNIREQKGLTKKEILFKATNPFDMSILPYFLPDLYKTFKQLKFTVLPRGYSVDVFQMVAEKKIQLGFVNHIKKNERNIKIIPLFTEPIVLVTHPNHRLASKEIVDLTELQNETVLYVDSAVTYWKSVFRFLQKQGIHIGNKVEINSTETIKNVVMENPEVVTLITRMCVIKEMNRGALHIVPLAPEIPKLTTYLIYNIDLEQPELISFIQKKTKEIYSSFS